nr:hypothetical protein [Tanacetum cinerariifolium]
MKKCDTVGTPMDTKPKLDVDLSGKLIDQTKYRSKIRTLMYLTSSRPDIVQPVCYCARGIQFLGDKLVSWMPKKQDSTVMSSAEAEYVALSASCAQVMWMGTQLKDYGFNYKKIPLYCDSQSAITISCNPVQHSCTKTEYQLVYMFTKALPKDRFHYLVRRIGMRCLTSAELKARTNDDVVASFQHSRIHYYMLMLKLQTYYKHQDSRIKKAQELKTKTFAYSDIKDNSSETKLQGRLLESFQDDAKYEHVDQDTRSQGGKDDQDIQGKDLEISKQKMKSKDND